MRRVGLLVNPVAGMGGRVGLKGTDRPDEAARRGAKPVAIDRAVRFLASLRNASIFTAGGAMGEDACERSGTSAMVVYSPASPSTAEDTREATRALAAAGIDVLVFVGGDGTAADVASGLPNADIPVLGVPSGVKMYSGVFAETPERAATVVETFDALGRAEVLDIDEEAFRSGELRVALKGALSVPSHKAVQAGKLAGEDDEVEQASLAEAASERILDGETWILGAGTTMAAVKAALGIDGTLLGVDAVRREGGTVRVLARDAAERDLLGLPPPVNLMVSPIGAQGFILGRGNQQVSPEVLGSLAKDAMLIVATPTKLLTTPDLRVDSGDPGLDARLRGVVRVLTGHHGTRIARVR